MNCELKTKRSRAFTAVELLVIVVVIFLLGALLLPALARSKAKAKRIQCTTNLKQIGLAFRLGGRGSTNQVSWPVVGGWTNYAAEGFRRMLGPSGAPGILVCPADTRRAAASMRNLSDTNLSYFLGLDADESMPQMLLAGDRNLTLNGAANSNRIVILKAGDTLGFTKALHNCMGNVALADGSVQNVFPSRLTGLTGGMTNRLAVP